MLTLRKGILLALILSTLIPSTVLMVVRLSIGSERTRDLYANRMRSVARALSESLDKTVAMSKDNVILLSTSYNMREYLKTHNDPSAAGRDAEFYEQLLYENFVRYTEKLNNLDDVFLLDASGTVVLSCHPEVAGRDMSGADYFTEHSRHYERHETDYVFISRAHDSVTQPQDVNRRGLAFSRCITDDGGNLQYVLVCFYNAERLGAVTDGGAYGETGISFIIDRSNYILHHPEARFSSTYTVASMLTDLVSRYNNGEIEQSGSFDDVLDGTRRMYCYEVLPQAGMAVVLRQDFNEFSADITRDVLVTVCFMAVTVGASVIASLLVSKKLSSPVRIFLDIFKKGQETGTYEANHSEYKGEVLALVSGYNGMVRTMEAQKKVIDKEKERSEYLYNHDSLTGLYNRTAFEKEFAKSLKSSGLTSGDSAGLIVLDIRGFKNINNTFGHHVGDEVLREVGRKISESEGRFEAVARAGNGQYLLAKIGGRAEIDAALVILHNELSRTFEIGQSHVTVSVNMGVTVYPQDGLSIDKLMTNADIAMANARENELTKHVYFEQHMFERINRKGLILEVLRDCVASGEIFLMYQPFCDLRDNRLTGFEALMRIRSKQLGLLSPLEFIPLSETVPELAVSMGNWALNEACRFLRGLIDKKNFGGIVSVNLSPLQIMDEKFTAKVLAVLSEHSVPGSQLQLEITEKSVNGYVEEFAPKFEELRKHGVLISLDDFGGVRSSFYFLSHLPLDAIKVDQAFFTDFKSEKKTTQINKSLMELAKRFDLRVSAERVETQSDSDMLKSIGFDGAQGYFYSLPLAEDKIDEFLG